MESIEINLPHPFDLQKTVTAHGWVGLAPFRWSPDTETLGHAETIDGRIVSWTVCQAATSRLSVEVDAPPVDGLVREVTSRVSRCLMLDWNPAEAIHVASRVDPEVAQYLKDGGGRLLRGTTFFEDLYKTICTINTSWANTVRLSGALAVDFGQGSAPSPVDIIENGIAALGEIKMGYRKEVLYGMTEELLNSRRMGSDGNLTNDGLTRDELLAFRGIGPYAADHLRVLQCDYEHIPVDSEVRSHLGLAKGSDHSEVDSVFSGFGQFRFLGYKIGRVITRSSLSGESK